MLFVAFSYQAWQIIHLLSWSVRNWLLCYFPHVDNTLLKYSETVDMKFESTTIKCMIFLSEELFTTEIFEFASPDLPREIQITFLVQK
jgi:hypothetical protein